MKTAKRANKPVVIMRSSAEWRADLAEAFAAHGWGMQKGMEVVLGGWLKMEKAAVRPVGSNGKGDEAKALLGQISASLAQLEGMGLLPATKRK